MIIFLKKILNFFIAFAIAYIILFGLKLIVIYFYDHPIRNIISKSVTQNNIEKLILGMEEKDIIRILGKPFSKSHKESDSYVFRYAKEGLPFGSGIEVSVHVKNKIYIGIYMESFDSGFYKCTLKSCPKITDKNMYNQHIPIK